MRVQCDDDLYRVDRVYLGPRGKPWPLRATYRGWVMAGIIMLAVLIVWRMIGLPTPWMVLLGVAAGSYWLGQRLDRWFTADRPILSELGRVFQELAAPRPDLHPEPVTWRHEIEVTRWGPGAPPRPRWWKRLAAKIRALRDKTRRHQGRVYEQGGWRSVK
jgi:hypothetical protein